MSDVQVIKPVSSHEITGSAGIRCDNLESRLQEGKKCKLQDGLILQGIRIRISCNLCFHIKHSIGQNKVPNSLQGTVAVQFCALQFTYSLGSVHGSVHGSHSLPFSLLSHVAITMYTHDNCGVSCMYCYCYYYCY